MFSDLQQLEAYRRGMRLSIALLALPLLLGGCAVGTVASTAVEVATLPVRVVSEGVDAVTTTQAEADRRRGRRLREEDERRGREARRAEELREREERRAAKAARRGRG